MSFESPYITVDSSIATFEDGSLPGWMSQETSGGGSVTVSGDDLGSATLETGTTATNDSARIRADTAVDVGGADAVGVRAVFSTTEVSGDNVTLIGLQNSGDSELAVHLLNKDELDTESGGVSSVSNTRITSNGKLYSAEIIIDELNQWVRHRVQNTHAVTKNTDLPADGTAFEADVFIQTKDTNDNRVIEVFELEVARLRYTG